MLFEMWLLPRWRAAAELRRNAYGFEIDRQFYRRAKDEMLGSDVLNQVQFDDILIEQRRAEQMSIAGVM